MEDCADAASFDQGVQAAGDGFDFGQFGHQS
jgi:hypothetical protein